jgi:hypothetical protein
VAEVSLLVWAQRRNVCRPTVTEQGQLLLGGQPVEALRQHLSPLAPQGVEPAR